MSRAKDELAEREDKGKHLDCCLKCGTVLRTRVEREMMTCENCFEYTVEKD